MHLEVHEHILLLSMSTPQRPEPHLDVSTLQRNGLHLNSLHYRGLAAPGVVWQQEPVLLLDVSTPQGSELHLDVSRLQEPVKCAASVLAYNTAVCALTGRVYTPGV